MSQLPVSTLIRQGNRLDDAEDKRRTKDEYRRQKDLEEQRKAGQAPAMVDIETGRDINPHIPEFIEKTPWYVPSSGPTLKHQRPHPEREKRLASIKDWYKKGTTDKIAFKYRDGACENCGAMGHKKKDCFEKPRKIGAKFNDQVIAADDYVVPNFKLSYDAKRDRWNGYDSAEYKQVHDEYEKMEETRKLIRAKNLEDGIEAEDEDKYADDIAPGQSVDMDSRTRITVRNLRIREDTAKYLYNLSENSAYYDPKSRSMRENPFENMPGMEKEAVKFSGENFVRYTGEVVSANEAQVFAWQARCKGIDVHALAEPTKLEALKRAYEKEKKEYKGAINQELINKYGGQEHLNIPEKELLLAQTENYVEYNRTGKVIKGEERPTVKSRYDEDIFINNHTTVFGSYWRGGKWGYKCCHSLLKNSYCIGKQGILMEESINEIKIEDMLEKQNKLSVIKNENDLKNSLENVEENSDVDDESESELDDNDNENEEEDFKKLEKEREEMREKKRETRRKKRQRQKEKRKTSLKTVKKKKIVS